MKTLFTLNYLPVVGCSNLTNPTPSSHILIPFKLPSHLKYPPSNSLVPTKNPCKSIQIKVPITQKPLKHELNLDSANGYLRFAVVGAASLGIALFVMEMDENSRALALGPEGPLMEEFWDNRKPLAYWNETASPGARGYPSLTRQSSKKIRLKIEGLINRIELNHPQLA